MMLCKPCRYSDIWSKIRPSLTDVVIARLQYQVLCTQCLVKPKHHEQRQAVPLADLYCIILVKGGSMLPVIARLIDQSTGILAALGNKKKRPSL
jgi:hypothetical protein